MLRFTLLALAGLSLSALSSCSSTMGSTSGTGGPANMSGPSAAQRNAQIAAEPRGDFFYGRRYFVNSTRFWGYLRRPGAPASTGKLVIMDESRTRVPDRLPETGPSGRRWGYDQNYQYKVYGNYTGETVYEPNSNQFLPAFRPTRFELVNTDPGWLFTPSDHYDPYRLTLVPPFR